MAAMTLVFVRAPRRWVDRVYVGFARLALRLAGTHVEVHGREHVRPGSAYVVVPNHESGWDPVVLVAALAPLPLRLVVKAETMRTPLLGRALLWTGNVRVDRTDTAADVARVRAAMARRPSDLSVVFYAEGTRSRDGALHAFKTGPFATAIDQGLPILPVATAGTRPIWPPDTFAHHRGTVVVEIGPPIPVAGLELEARHALRTQAADAVRRLRARARARLRALGGEPGGIDGAVILPFRRTTVAARSGTEG